jgi:queuine tRNA-ribosyltransferase
MFFNLEASDDASNARAGIINTAHGSIETPIFMPVGTAGTVKAVDADKLIHTVKAQIILGNTYHLYLRPGLEVLEAANGLHGFAKWPLPLLTDSGGYQVFSLASNRKITEEGVRFRSHIDGSSHMFSPERSMEIQRIIGADIVMAFDECPPYPATEAYTETSMHLTHRWLDRSLAYMHATKPLYGYEQYMFPIVQGGTYPHLRVQSAQYCAHVAESAGAGISIGGLSVGEPAELMYDTLHHVMPHLPANRPRYLMGVGTPANIIEAIALGVDMFDCVMPTRNGRNGYIFTTEGIINIRNKRWERDFTPLDPNLPGAESQQSKAYVRHLFVAGELLGLQIASVQNLALYLWLVGQCRAQIRAGTYGIWYKAKAEQLMQRL